MLRYAMYCNTAHPIVFDALAPSCTDSAALHLAQVSFAMVHAPDTITTQVRDVTIQSSSHLMGVLGEGGGSAAKTRNIY